MPRVLVRAVDSAGQPLADVFTRQDGTFRIDVGATECRVTASLTGFVAVDAPCGTDIQLTLRVSPIAEAIVVTANRSETPAAQIAASAAVFSSEDITRRQRPPVADLLATVPGVVVSRSGGYGNVTSLFVRGGESNYNKVLLDGIPLNEPGGVFNFSSLTSENLERIEIVRGAQSALFGSDAMASVIQLFTRRSDPGSRLQVGGAFEAGGYDTVRGEVTARGALGRVDYAFGAARLTTDNREPNSEFHNTTVSASAGYRVMPAAVLRGVFRGEFGSAGTPGQTAFGRPDLDAHFDRRDMTGGITLLHDPSPTFRHRLTYGLSRTDQSSINLEQDPAYTPSYEGRLAAFEFSDFPYHSRNRLHRHYASYQADWTVGAGASSTGTHQVTTAIDWDGERGSLGDEMELSETEITRNNFGATVQHQASWPRLFATAGLRLERNESFGTSAAPRASLAWIARRSTTMWGETRLKTSVGRGIKEPTALQTFSRSPFFLGNPDLRPEEAVTFDVGLEQRFARDRLRVEATWFDNAFKNIIGTSTISFVPFVSQYVNVGRSEAQGVELSAAFATSHGLAGRGGYTWLDSKVVESRTPEHPVFGVGQWAFRRPRHSGFIETALERGRLGITVTGLFVGRRVDSDFVSLSPAITSSDPYTRWDARASYRLATRLALTFAVDNIGRHEYMDPAGYRALGRTARGGMRIGF